jgi:hypothetical protein
MPKFTTNDCPPADRFDAFQEFVTRAFKTETQRLDDPTTQPFHGSISVTPLGHISFSTLAGTPTAIGACRAANASGRTICD